MKKFPFYYRTDHPMVVKETQHPPSKMEQVGGVSNNEINIYPRSVQGQINSLRINIRRKNEWTQPSNLDGNTSDTRKEINGKCTTTSLHA